MPKKMTVTEVKKKLAHMSQKELIALISRLYKASTEVVNILNIELGDPSYENELLEESKQKIHKIFFPGRGMAVPSLSKAKKVISDFNTASGSFDGILELKVYYAECVSEYGNGYGDMPESFYDSLESVFDDIVTRLNKKDEDRLYEQYYQRLQKVVDNMDGLGFGTADGVNFSLLNELNWSPKE